MLQSSIEILVEPNSEGFGDGELLACAQGLSNPAKASLRVANRINNWLEVLLITSAGATVRAAGCGCMESGH